MPGTPAVGDDGTIYLPAGALNEFDPGKGYLYAINPNGTQKWRLDLPGPPGSTAPAIGSDGTIYVHMNGGEGNEVAIERLWAVNPNGTKKWEFQSNGGSGIFTAPVQSSPAVGTDGTVWVGSINTVLYALDPSTGDEVCKAVTDGSISSSPAIASDGTVYVISDDTHLYAVRPSDCNVLWIFQLLDHQGGDGIAGENDESPAIAADGTIWAPSIDNYLYAVTPSATQGTQKCRFGTGDFFMSAPAIAADGTVYVMSDGLYAVNPSNCTQKWRYAPFGSQYSSASPIVDGDGNVYAGLLGIYYVSSLTPAGDERWSLAVDPHGGGGADPTAAIGEDGVLYQGDGGFVGPERLRAIVGLPRTLTTTKTGSGNGTVTSSPAGIDCGSTCSHAFDYGTSVSLSATPQAGSTFASWSGDCSGTGACTVTMTGTRYVGATFSSQTATTPTTPTNPTTTTTTTTTTPTGPGSTAQVCVVPNVKGKTLAVAKRKIAGAHCSVGKLTRKFHARIKKGRVISQAPAAGKRLAKGARVNLVVSKGKKSS